MVPKIAVVEDEEALSVLLRYNLESEGYDVDTIPRGDEAEIRLQERHAGSFDPRLDVAGASPASSFAVACACVRKPNVCRSSC